MIFLERASPGRRIFLASLLFALTLLPLAGVFAQQQNLQSFEKDEVVFILADGSRHVLEVEMAETWPQKMQGLMYRRELAQDAGMLFIYEGERERAMWMKNTYIPLDIIFIDSGGRIVGLAERTVPQSLATIRSRAPALAVLEVNAGTVSRLGIARGDKVLHTRFGNTH